MYYSLKWSRWVILGFLILDEILESILTTWIQLQNGSNSTRYSLIKNYVNMIQSFSRQISLCANFCMYDG